MEYQRALIAARNGKALLFTGAGFSRKALSLDNNEFPDGRTLAKNLCAEAGVPVTDDLKQASSRYLRTQSPEQLIERLSSIFTAKEVADIHRGIAEVPWKAIYTTNYDNVLERAAADVGKKLLPVTTGREPREIKKSADVVVHINGYVDLLDNESLNTTFKLTNSSYLTQQFRESVWSEVFVREIHSAQAVFFVGYSLYDIDIQEILFADETLRKKTFFIQRDDMNPDELKYSELNEFGSILPIGIDKFVADLQAVDPTAISNDTSLVLTGFGEVKLEPVPGEKLKDSDVFDLLLKGEIKRQAIVDQIASGAKDTYIFGREALTHIEENLPTNSNFTILGDLGNGKTLLLNVLSAHLLRRGFRVFWLKDEAYDCFDEVEQILGLDAPVALVFDNYTRKMKLLAHANQKRKSNSVLLVSARTSTHELFEEDLYFAGVRLDLQKTLEIDVNKLADSDIERLSRYFEQYGLWGEKANLHPEAKIRYLKKDCNSELHGALLGLLNSPQIQQRFATLFDDIKSAKQFTRTVIAAFTLNMLNFSRPTLHMIAAMANDSAVFNPAFKSNASMKQLFNNERGHITPKSSVLAEYALKNFPDVTILVDSLVDICRATRKKADANQLYWDIYRDLASFRHVQRILPEAGKRDSLIRFYQGLRTIEVERKNPHFWLQYAIARLTYPDAQNLEQAKQYLETALSLAHARPAYTTNDIETQYARYFLEHAIHVEVSPALAYASFQQAHGILSKVTRVEKYKREPFRPTRLYEALYKKFKSAFTDDQKKGYAVAIDAILQNIMRLPPKTADDKTVLAARESLESVRRLLPS